MKIFFISKSFFDKKSQISTKIIAFSNISKMFEKVKKFIVTWDFCRKKNFLTQFFQKTHILCKIITKYEGTTPKTPKVMTNILFLVGIVQSSSSTWWNALRYIAHSACSKSILTGYKQHCSWTELNANRTRKNRSTFKA